MTSCQTWETLLCKARLACLRPSPTVKRSAMNRGRAVLSYHVHFTVRLQQHLPEVMLFPKRGQARTHDACACTCIVQKPYRTGIVSPSLSPPPRHCRENRVSSRVRTRIRIVFLSPSTCSSGGACTIFNFEVQQQQQQ